MIRAGQGSRPLALTRGLRTPKVKREGPILPLWWVMGEPGFLYEWEEPLEGFRWGSA